MAWDGSGIGFAFFRTFAHAQPIRRRGGRRRNERLHVLGRRASGKREQNQIDGCSTPRKARDVPA